ncbi:MAG: hypothetical protein ACI94O_002243 [Octadecabacter sp.]|jgi:hypothetical protein
MVHCVSAKPERGLKENVVRADPYRRPNATAAPATVSGECSSTSTEGNLGKGDEVHIDPRARRPAVRDETDRRG